MMDTIEGTIYVKTNDHDQVGIGRLGENYLLMTPQQARKAAALLVHAASEIEWAQRDRADAKREAMEIASHDAVIRRLEALNKLDGISNGE